MKSITPAENPRAKERFFVLKRLVSSTITPPSPVDSPARRVRSNAVGKLLPFSIVCLLASPYHVSDEQDVDAKGYPYGRCG